MKDMFKGIVFDLDGTLVDSLSVTFDAFNHGMMSQGCRKHTPEEIMRYFGTGESEIFVKLIGPEKAPRAYTAARDYLDAHLGKIPLHDGVGEILEELKSRSVPLAIFTGRSWMTTELILKYHGILDRFITVIAHDHVKSPKPSPEGLHLALAPMKLAPSEVFFVGDSDVDILAAHAAGSTGVAALWDLLANPKKLEHSKPHHWARKPLEILDYWEQITRS
jgi:HAD superfamily hydrolase (TIGR01509 family)